MGGRRTSSGIISPTLSPTNNAVFPASDTIKNLVQQYIDDTGGEVNPAYKPGFYKSLFPELSAEDFTDKLVPFVYQKYGETGVKRMLTQAFDEREDNIGKKRAQNYFSGLANSDYRLHDMAMRMWTSEKMVSSSGTEDACAVMRNLEHRWKNGLKFDKTDGTHILSKICLDHLNQYVTLKSKVYGKPIYRGLKMSKSDFYKAIQAGEFDGRGIASWSTTKSIAAGFAKTNDKSLQPVVLVQGKWGRGAYIADVSAYPHEKEVLVKDAKYKILDTAQKKGYIEVYLDN